MDITENQVVELYKRIQSKLLKDGASVQDAEDVCQQTFLQALAQPKPFSELKPSWFFRVARNLFLNRIKHEQRQIPVSELELLEEDSTPLVIWKLSSNDNISEACEELLHPSD